MHNKLHRKLDYWIVLVAIILFAIAIGIALYLFSSGYSMELLSSIVAGLVVAFVVAFVTIFGIDRILARREAAAWRQAKSSVLNSIGSYLDMMLQNIGHLAHIHLPYVNAPEFDLEYYVEHLSEIHAKHFKENFTSLLGDAAQELRNRDREAWKLCFSGIESSVNELNALLATVPATSWAPNLLEKVVALRDAARAFIMIGHLFEAPPMPSPNKQQISTFNYNRLITKLDYDIAISSLQSLVKKILELREVVSASPDEPS